MNTQSTFDAVVVGGGPAGATAAQTLAAQGRSVLMIDRDGRITQRVEGASWDPEVFLRLLQ